MMGEMADFRKLAMHHEMLCVTAHIEKREAILDGYAKDLESSLHMVNRCAQLIENIKADFHYSLERLIAASEGLVNYFGYTIPIVDNVEFNRIEEWSNIDLLATWTRNAIQWLAAFNQNDQYFVFPISLFKNIGKEHFTEAITAAQNDQNKGFLILPFLISEELITTHFLLRINGVSMYVYSRDKTDRVWRAKLEIPKVGVSVREVGDNIDIPQIAFPPVYFGRITHRNSHTGAELVGTNSICNASPICPGRGVQWILQIYSQTGDGSDFNSLEDIEVELHLSGIPK